MDKKQSLEDQIERLTQHIKDQEEEIENKIADFAEREKLAKQDHEDMVKSIKVDMQSKQDKLTEILTTPKQPLTIKSK